MLAIRESLAATAFCCSGINAADALGWEDADFAATATRGALA